MLWRDKKKLKGLQRTREHYHYHLIVDRNVISEDTNKTFSANPLLKSEKLRFFNNNFL